MMIASDYQRHTILLACEGNEKDFIYFIFNLSWLKEKR